MTAPEELGIGNSEVPRLPRVLSLVGAVGFGLAYMMPLASFTTFGIANTVAQGGIVPAYALTLVALLFTAGSYAAMASRFPAVGSAYSYTRRTLGAHIGFLGGWAILLDYVLLPMMAYLVIGIYLNAAILAVPQWVWGGSTIVIVTVLNVLGVKLLSRVSNALVVAQAVFLVVFVAMAAGTAFGKGIPSIYDVMLGSNTSMTLLFAGAAVLCYSFLGFDAISSIAEETRDAARTIPCAIMIATLVAGVLFIVVCAVSNLVFPDWTAYSSPDSASTDIIRAIGGRWLELLFTAVFIAGNFGAVMAQQATAARVLFSMGRDGVLPRRLFGILHRRWQTPARATLFISLVGVSALFVNLTLGSSLINFGALTAYSLVNVAVIKYFYFDQKRRRGWDICRFLVFPSIGFILCVWLWTSLSSAAFVLGLSWLAVGAVYLAVLTRGFGAAPPELELGAANGSSEEQISRPPDLEGPQRLQRS